MRLVSMGSRAWPSSTVALRWEREQGCDGHPGFSRSIPGRKTAFRERAPQRMSRKTPRVPRREPMLPREGEGPGFGSPFAAFPDGTETAEAHVPHHSSFRTLTRTAEEFLRTSNRTASLEHDPMRMQRRSQSVGRSGLVPTRIHADGPGSGKGSRRGELNAFELGSLDCLDDHVLFHRLVSAGDRDVLEGYGAKGLLLERMSDP